MDMMEERTVDIPPDVSPEEGRKAFEALVKLVEKEDCYDFNR